MFDLESPRGPSLLHGSGNDLCARPFVYFTFFLYPLCSLTFDHSWISFMHQLHASASCISFMHQNIHLSARVTYAVNIQAIHCLFWGYVVAPLKLDHSLGSSQSAPRSPLHRIFIIERAAGPADGNTSTYLNITSLDGNHSRPILEVSQMTILFSRLIKILLPNPAQPNIKRRQRYKMLNQKEPGLEYSIKLKLH
ncbi:hypothetical protein L228DRAFT_117257 [Xylona heveae TC161]|uniref:Uncharacterized protein n=1 Tax=Xylona heveae (strain CBS 132557 / TC161) TaxID=1328760 RepID=A0A165HGP3_XYLHT|nr:hypothetical protein L228DRAFT_117257 [Xylona heveae TC161]KZF23486.1 hypothetical protein L228DRAFT_117257 [Xylona heveae TC161]